MFDNSTLIIIFLYFFQFDEHVLGILGDPRRGLSWLPLTLIGVATPRARLAWRRDVCSCESPLAPRGSLTCTCVPKRRTQSDPTLFSGLGRPWKVPKIPLRWTCDPCYSTRGCSCSVRHITWSELVKCTWVKGTGNKGIREWHSFPSQVAMRKKNTYLQLHRIETNVEVDQLTIHRSKDSTAPSFSS